METAGNSREAGRPSHAGEDRRDYEGGVLVSYTIKVQDIERRESGVGRRGVTY